MMIKPLQAHDHAQYENNGKGPLFQFDYDNDMIRKYILSII